jgi:hypothetical protein
MITSSLRNYLLLSTSGRCSASDNDNASVDAESVQHSSVSPIIVAPPQNLTPVSAACLARK